MYLLIVTKSKLRSGREAGFPYSLSRWTDVPHAKWSWFMESLKGGAMIAFDPTTAIPAWWSLRPEDTLGLVFWTKDPTNLLFDAPRLRDHKVKIHVTATGWEEVEKGAPTLRQAANLVGMTAEAFGVENVTWRFSPVPIVPDVVERFDAIMALAASVGIQSVYLSFLQENDLMPETRSEQDRLNLLAQMAELGAPRNVKVYLCNEDRLLAKYPGYHSNLASGVCAPPEDFALEGRSLPPSEGCGCVLMVDPFTQNESCTLGCKYCYAANNGSAAKKRNTTKTQLPIVR